MTWFIICALALLLIGMLSVQSLRPGGALSQEHAGARRFPRPWRLAYTLGCFVVLVIIMLSSTAGTGVRIAVIAVGGVVCVVQYLVLEAIYGGTKPE